MQNRKRIFAFVVIVACTLSCSFSNAQEPSPGQTPSPSPTSISPDKKWEYRVEDDDSAVLLRSDREKPVIKLSDPENDGSLKTKTGKLIWGAGLATVRLQWIDNDTFEALAYSEGGVAMRDSGEAASLITGVLFTVKCDNRGNWNITGARELNEEDAMKMFEESETE
jgi:hypothetical protein